MKEHPRGTVVLAQDPYTSKSRRRPFVIVSDENYPFGRHEYLGVPLTRKDKPNTFEVTDYDKEEVFEDFEKDANYVNPYSPVQVNNPDRPLCRLSESFVDILADNVKKAIGI